MTIGMVEGTKYKLSFSNIPEGYVVPDDIQVDCASFQYSFMSKNIGCVEGDDNTLELTLELQKIIPDEPITALAACAMDKDTFDDLEVKYTLTIGDWTSDEATMTMSGTSLDLSSVSDINGKEATLTITSIPDGYKMPTSPFTFALKYDETYFEDTEYQFGSISIHDGKATFALFLELEADEDSDVDDDENESPFTVKAVVNDATTDKDADKDGVQVNAKDTVKIDVVVSGDDFTNADWEMEYDPTLFTYVSTTTNVDTTKSTVTLDDTKMAVLSGSLIANAGVTAGDEFEDGTAIVTYEFTATSGLKADKTGTFKITSAHANNYVIAGTEDNKVANTENATVEIVLVDNTSSDDEEGTVTVPAGTFTAAEKVYNALNQTGNAFVLDEGFENAKVTYFATDDGSELSEDEDIEDQKFKTTLPSWKNVGVYTYYAKITGDGLKDTYVSTTLTITAKELVPSAMFDVDPNVTEVKFTPTLEGVVDGSHNGTVTVKYTDAKNGEQTLTLNASDFVYDGETTSVYKNVITAVAPESGDFVVTLEYTVGDDDNYTGGENTVKVDVDKISADEAIVKALEEAITTVFGYDSTAHSVVIDDEAIEAIENGTWEYTYDTTAAVTNVGEDVLVKIVFNDTTNNYNEVVVYAVLKVTPALVTITVNDNDKVMNEDDPDPITDGTIVVVDEDGNAVEGTFNGNGLYGTDNLEVTYEREAGEDVGEYDITASYVPNDNYTVTIVDGTFTITEPVIDPDDEDAIVKVEVVDLSNEADGTPDYTAGKRLILVYTDVDKLFYGYGDDVATAERMFDVTAAGYKYVNNEYDEDGNLTATKDDHEYKHVYGIVVDGLDSENTGTALQTEYLEKVIFLSSDLTDAPENIVYDGNINLSTEIDVNDYSMTNGIYNNSYARTTYIKNILKADINGDKKVDTDDVLNVKNIVEAKN